MTDELRLSVVMVSDFEPSHLKSWRDEKALIQALSEQDINEHFEVILVESEQSRNQIVPEEFYHLIPNFNLHYFDSIKSAALKDYGVSCANGRYIAVLESDCIPSKNWLRLLLGAITNNEYVIASGRTYYGEETSYRRIMNLLHRSWDDHEKSCETECISNNGAIYDRKVLEMFPYPESVTPFLSAQARNESILNAGHRFYFVRDATMKHAIGGLQFVWDFQRNKGHQSMKSRRHCSYSAIPVVLIRKLKNNLKYCARFGKEYLCWYDWLPLPVLMLAEFVPFTVGMIDAIRGVQKIPNSAYR